MDFISLQNPPRLRQAVAEIVTVCRMEYTIPRGDWLEAESFRKLLNQVAALDLGGWSLPEFERATSALGWELKPPEEVAGQVLRRFAARKGPWGGYGTVMADPSTPDQVGTLNVRVVDLPAENVSTAAGLVRAAWWVMEQEFGPPTLWGGDIGPWMLWRRPDTSFLVHSHDGGEVSLELLHTNADADTAGRDDSRGSWRASTPSDLPVSPTRTSGASWDDVQKRLYEALRALNHDTPFLPGRFILRLESAREPDRLVQCWSQDLDLVIEATGYVHHPELADSSRLADSGWEPAQSLWQRRLPNAMENSAHAKTAVHMLVEELQNLDIDLADLVYNGTMDGRGQSFHLDLPKLGIPRTAPDA